MSFKLMPFVIFHEQGDVDERPEAHYTFEMKSIAMEAIKENERDENDDCDSYSTEDMINKRELAESLLKGGNTLDGIKTIHFDDTCKVPRFKLGELCGSKGIRVIRDRGKADAVIYGSKFPDALFSSRSVDYFNYKADFISQAKRIKAKRNLITEILPLVEACESDVILIEGYDNGSGTGCKLSVRKRIKTDSTPNFDLSYIEVVDESKYLSATGKNNLIHQDVILEQLSSIVMDDDMYRSICSMFESPSKENHLVAMELMSSTSYKKSIVYLLNLMRKYYHDKIKEVPEKSNISFKAFQEYVEYKPDFCEGSLNGIIDIVIDKKALTEDNYKLILKLIMEQEKENMSQDNWIITSLDLAPEQKAKVIWDKVEQPILIEAL